MMKTFKLDTIISCKIASCKVALKSTSISLVYIPPWSIFFSYNNQPLKENPNQFQNFEHTTNILWILKVENIRYLTNILWILKVENIRYLPWQYTIVILLKHEILDLLSVSSKTLQTLMGCFWKLVTILCTLITKSILNSRPQSIDAQLVLPQKLDVAYGNHTNLRPFCNNRPVNLDTSGSRLRTKGMWKLFSRVLRQLLKEYYYVVNPKGPKKL